MMNKNESVSKQSYEAPRAEGFRLAAAPLSVLTSFSAEAGIEDWQEDDDAL